MVAFSKNTLGVSDLIRKLKQDLLSNQSSDDPGLFSIDEIVLEINYLISGDIDSGSDFGVVTLGSQINEERVQKIVVKMSPIVSKEQLVSSLNNNANHAKESLEASSKTLLRGGNG